MPTNRTPIQRARRWLSFDQEMSLRFGERADHPAFRSDTERREAWLRHRDRLLAGHLRGRRPAAWWDYQAPVPFPREYEYEEATLFEAGLLFDDERAELLTRWREEFDRAQEPGFAHCIGHAKPGDTFATWLKGTAAKRAHYAWAGIPNQLVAQWAASQRRRQARRPAKGQRSGDNDVAEHPLIKS